MDWAIAVLYNGRKTLLGPMGIYQLEPLGGNITEIWIQNKNLPFAKKYPPVKYNGV